MKLNEKLIKQLRSDEIAVKNNGSVQQLREVLKAAFPEYGELPVGDSKYYSRSEFWVYGWKSSSFKDKSKPVFKISDFYKPEQVESTKLIADAFDTANKTDKTPSEIKQERDQLIRVLQDFISSCELVDDEFFSMEIGQAKRLINRIENKQSILNTKID